MHPFLGSLGYGLNGHPMTNTAFTTVSLTPSGTAYNNITPVEAFASLSYDVAAIHFRLPAPAATAAASGMCVFEVMGGAGGSEYVLATIPAGKRGVGFNVNLPLFVPSGTRLSLRVRSHRITTAYTTTLGVSYAPNRDNVGLPTRWVIYGFSDDGSTTARGTNVVPGATNAWGSWTSLTTSTTYAHDLWLPMIDGGSRTATTAKSYTSQWAPDTTANAATMVTNGTVWNGQGWNLTTGETLQDTYTGPAVTGGSFGLGCGPNGIVYHPLPSGSAWSVRAMCSGTVDTDAIGASVLAAI